MELERSRKRRRYSSELKAEILVECDAQGASVAKVAMAHGINANILHGWYGCKVRHHCFIGGLVNSSISTLHRRSVKRFPMAVTTPAARSGGSAAAHDVPEHIQPHRDRVKIA